MSKAGTVSIHQWIFIMIATATTYLVILVQFGQPIFPPSQDHN
ncbi:unnamed protein product [Nezara viridula]|nr:unnamed protein product [Nezara viridula]